MEFTSSTSSSSYLVDYLSPDPTSDPLSTDHSQDPFSSPMSPVQSAASTPPLSAAAQSNNNTNNNHHFDSSMASFATPVPLSTAPYSMPIPSFPRRAEHSYAQNYMPNPYTMGAPPPPNAAPRPRGPQLPSASLIQPQQSTYVPDVPSSAPDAPPSGAGGSRKRPKYTRSKKGCLTCRSKKIKCDERKPLCTRCEHGHRECTWPETVLPRRPKGAVRGVGNEDDEEGDDERRGSIPGSAVSSHFPSSTTSAHFPGIGTNSPFDTDPRDGYTNGSQFPLPVLPANTRPFYPRPPGSGPSGDFYPVTTVNGQPIDDYEFPPRQTYGAGSSSGSAPRAYPSGSLYATGPPGTVPSYNGDMRRASWDSTAPTDGRRPSWDATSLAVSSASSPSGSALGLGLGGIGGRGGPSGSGTGSASGATSAGSSAGGNGASSSGTGGPGGSLMLFQSPDPLSPFFRSVQERNLVGTISSFITPSSTPTFSSSSPFSSASSFFSQHPLASDASAVAAGAAGANQYLSASPVLSSASSNDFGVTPEGLPYRKNSYPHLYPPPRPLTLDPPALVVAPGAGSVDFSTPVRSSMMSEGTAKSDAVDWLAPPTMDIYRPPSMDGEEYVSWDAYS